MAVQYVTSSFIYHCTRADFPHLAVLGGLGCAVFAGTIIVVWGWMGLILLLIYSYWRKSRAAASPVAGRVLTCRSAVPQIVLNVQRGAARQTLRREYIIGTTLCRLVLPTYFWGYGKNVLAVETSRASLRSRHGPLTLR